MKKVLGLDINLSSVGWAVVNEAEHDVETSSLVKIGVRATTINSDELYEFERGMQVTTLAQRRERRRSRRRRQRYKLRRTNLIETLKREGWITNQTPLAEDGSQPNFDTLRLRANAATEMIALDELARVLLMINKRRGYKSNGEDEKTDNEKQLRWFLGGMSERSKALDQLGLTIGQYLMAQADANPNACLRKQLFYRRDYLNEFETIWETQARYHKELTPELKEELRDRIIFYQRPLPLKKGKKNGLGSIVLEKVLSQTANVLNAIVAAYGKPDEIRVNVAVELKQSGKERQAQKKALSLSDKQNKQYEQLLKDVPFNLTEVSRDDIVRYRLYQELETNGYRTLYTDTLIQPEQLFSELFEVTHIIAPAKLFDNSFSNLLLEVRDAKRPNNEAYRERVERLFKGGIITKSKHDKLLMEEHDIPGCFIISREIRANQFVMRKVCEMLASIAPTVTPTATSVTKRLRKDWQLDGTKRDDHRHYAMNALAIAFTKPEYIDELNHLNTGGLHGDHPFDPPMEAFKDAAKKQLDSVLVSIKARNKVVTRNVNTTKKRDGTNSVVQLTPRGQLHHETLYGRKNGAYTIRKAVTPDLNIEKVIDPYIRNLLLQRLEACGGDTKIAFGNLDEQPIWLNEAKGIAVKRVKITGVTTAIPLHGEIDFVSSGNNHHIAFYRRLKADGRYKYDDNIVSFYMATQRAVKGLPVVDKLYKQDEGWEFMFTMKQNEMFVLPRYDAEGELIFNPQDHDEAWYMNPDNYAEISPHLFRVQIMSKVRYKQTLRHYIFRHHAEATVASEERGTAYETYHSTRFAPLVVKVRVDHLGRIVAVGEY